MLKAISGVIRLVGIGLTFPGTLLISFGYWIRPEDKPLLFGIQDLEDDEPLKICYHGTDEETAKKIIKEGFSPNTYFAQHLEDAIGFGGKHVFDVCFPKDTGSLSPWQFVHPSIVEPDLIVRCKHYEVEVLYEDKELGQRIFRSNMSPEHRRINDMEAAEEEDDV